MQESRTGEARSSKCGRFESKGRFSLRSPMIFMGSGWKGRDMCRHLRLVVLHREMKGDVVKQDSSKRFER